MQTVLFIFQSHEVWRFPDYNAIKPIYDLMLKCLVWIHIVVYILLVSGLLLQKGNEENGEFKDKIVKFFWK